VVSKVSIAGGRDRPYRERPERLPATKSRPAIVGRRATTRSFSPARLSFLAKFSLTSFVLLGLLAIALAWGLQRQMEESALKQEAASAADQVSYVLNHNLRAADLAGPLDPARYAQLDNLIRTNLLDEHTARVKIWSKDGLLLYSDEKSLVGQRFPLDHELIEALEGNIEMEVSDLTDAENVSERNLYSRLFEIYVPLRPSDSGLIEGVYEIYHDLATVQPRIEETRGFLWGSFGLGFVLLYGSLFTLVRNASRQLSRQSEENRRLYKQARRRLIERKRVSEALRANDKRLRAIFDNAAMGIALSRTDGILVESNRAFQDMLGYAPGELHALSFAQLTHPDDVQADLDYFTELVRRKRDSYQMEKRYIHKGGGVVWVNIVVSLIVDGAGKPQFVIAMIENITDRKDAQGQVKLQVERLAALRNIDIAISASLDLRVTLDVILEQATKQLNVDAAHVLLFNPRSQTLDRSARRGFMAKTNFLGASGMRLGEGYAGRAALERSAIFIPNLDEAEDAMENVPIMVGERFKAYFAVPLMAKGQVHGVLEIFHRVPFYPNDEWEGFLEALAGQAAIAVDNARLFEDLQRSNTELSLAYDTTLEGWSHALDLRDKETEGHTQRVTEMTMRLARAVGINEADLVHVRRGALLHDIGKMGIPDSILLKPGPLTEDEWEIMRRHPVYAYELLSPIEFLRPALHIPYSHHEKWDGTGYPRGLKAEQIPLAARIFAVIDVYDALSSDRPYRKAWPKEKVLAHLRSLSGTHFDPRVLETFLKMEGSGVRGQGSVELFQSR
jgi:PAS domain S-box-containing protein/putative nucleotidyltransferase with HDIG domain